MNKSFENVDLALQHGRKTLRASCLRAGGAEGWKEESIFAPLRAPLPRERLLAGYKIFWKQTFLKTLTSR